MARADSVGPTVNLWYGAQQTFGAPGLAQQWANVLGNVSDPDGVRSLSYRLNGGPVRTLRRGPDTRRLLKPGDFNIDIDFTDLVAGSNGLAITAQDNLFNTSITHVSLSYSAGTVWPLPFTVEPGSTSNLQDIAQVVDGLWVIEGDGLRCPDMGYDRVLAIGDLDWTDYEITATFTMLDMDPAGYQWPSVSPGFGITLRWPGHSDNPVVCVQPHCGWLPSGGTVWYNTGGDGPLSLNGDLDLDEEQERTLDFDAPYVFRMRVQDMPGQGTFYAVKVWPAASPEPGPWDMSGYEPAGDVASGSAIIIAHHVDILVEDISVISLGEGAPPVISNVVVTPGETSAIIAWTTNEVTTGFVSHGPTAAYELGNVASPTQGTSHSVQLNGLTSGQTYHFRITALDLDLDESSTPDDTFVPLADTDPPVISNVQITPEDVTALVTWTTDEPATSRVEFGLTEAYGNVTSNGALVTAHSVTLIGLDSQTLYHCRISSADAQGNAQATGDQTFTTLASPTGALVSDQFNQPALNTGVWTFVNPLNDSSLSMTGTQVRIDIPVTGNEHEMWIDENTAPRILQSAPNSDFEFMVKFDSPLTQSLQIQGVFVEQDPLNLIRAEYHFLGSQRRIYVATVFGGAAVTRVHQVISLSAPMYLRVTREGNAFTVSRSQNGETWIVAASFNQSMTVSGVGIHAGASGSTAHSMLADYFLDTSAPPIIDCNGNNIDDAQDISAGTSADCNASDVSDECELAGNDCDANSVPDECDADCDASGVPDACEALADCNTNGIPDACESLADCDSNGVPDVCESFADCNGNATPDACELAGNDCDANGVPDECDIDCNANNIPDDCESLPDCNENGTPDGCEVFADCDSNGVPDECDPDCNTNNIPDDCEALADCNSNGVPDECENLADCNVNGIPDDCETLADCDTNGIPDACESFIDCNSNATPDVCELAGNDCNANSVPDDCEDFADCNTNGMGDECELAAGSSSDVNSDAIPDECQVRNLSQGTAHEAIADAIDEATNGDELLANPSHFAQSPSIHFQGKALTLASTGKIQQPAGAAITLANHAELASAAGENLILAGTLTCGPLDRVDIVTRHLELAANGDLLVPVSAGIVVTAPEGALLEGSTIIQPLATLAFSSGVSVQGSVALLGGALSAAQLTILGPTALISGFGSITAQVASDADLIVQDNFQVVGDYENNGRVLVQNGTFSVIGSLSGSGKIIGAFVTAGTGERASEPALFISGNYQTAADGALTLPSSAWSLSIGGDLDMAIDGYSRFDMADAELRMVGTGATEQHLEALSADIGPQLEGLERTEEGRMPIGTLRIGPTPTTVRLVNAFPNLAGNTQAEAVYVDTLVISEGAMLITDGLHVYYRSLSFLGDVDEPANLIRLVGEPADCDLDGDVDVADAVQFTACLAGPQSPAPDTAPAGCPCLTTFDLDLDGDVDLLDFLGIQQLPERF